MRWFWLFILILVVLTAGLYTSRVRTNGVVAQPTIQPTPRPIIQPTVPHGTVADRPVEEGASEPGLSEPTIDEPIAQPIVVPEPEPEKIIEREEPVVVDEPQPEPLEIQAPIVIEEIPGAVDELATEAGGDEVAVAENIDEAVAEIVAEVIEENAKEDIPVEALPAPTFEQLADGSFRIFASNTHVPGSGTGANPFVLDWVTLRSIEQVYNPKKGKNELPGWLDLLHEKHVNIVGNTLVPVIATTTKELLVMQNPWDGCCVGIPPSPYDAIEVTLNHDVDFGSSAVGYGTVRGVFILDPYVVDGWVLGMYIIEDATYRSGDGIEFQDF